MNQCPECEKPKYVKCCHNCKKDGEKCEVCHVCGDDCPGWEGMTKTNADRIRAMTDEELAHFLAWHWNKKDYGLEWLKQPAE